MELFSNFNLNKIAFEQKIVQDLLFIGNISFDKITSRSGISRCVIGGGAYNSAYCASLVSNLKIKVFSVVGKDFPISIIKDRGIDVSGIHIVEEHSNTFIINEQSGDIFFENNQPLEFHLNNKEHAKHVHISCRKGIRYPYLCLKNTIYHSSSTDVISSSLKEKIDEIKKCLKAINMLCLKNTIYHSSSTDVISSSLKEKIDEIKKCLKAINMLFLNNYEYDMLNKCLDIETAHLFPKVIIFITKGKGGVTVKKHKKEISFPGINIKKEDIVSTTGSGDAFIGGFLGSYYSSRPFCESLAIGVSIATLSIQDFGISHVTNKLSVLDEYFNKLMPIYKQKEHEIYEFLQER